MDTRKLIIKIIENWPVKVLSIALALILFVFHRLNTLTTRPLSVPLTVETHSALTPASTYPRNIRVNLRGEDENVKTITDSDIEAYVDFTRYEEAGVYSAPVQIRRKGNALKVEPLEIAVSPSKISVQLDRRISKTVPLTAVIRGRVADGFALVSHSLSPLEVTVTGPVGSLESVSEIETDTIDLNGKNSDFTAEVDIINPSQLFVLRGSGTTEFSCIIRPSVSVRSIEGIPITLVALNPALEAEMGGRTGSIRIEGEQAELDAFRPPPDFFTVDCSGISGPGSFTLPIKFNLPRGFSLIRREPEELSLTVALKEAPL